MFTTGRIIFAVLFLIIFMIIIVSGYKKDADNHRRYYKNGAIKVAIYGGITILLFVLIRFLIKQ